MLWQNGYCDRFLSTIAVQNGNYLLVIATFAYCDTFLGFQQCHNNREGVYHLSSWMKCEMRKLGLSPQFEAIPTICVSAPAARALLTSTCPTPHGFTPSLALIRLCRRAKLQYDEVNCDVNAIKARFHGWAYSAHTSKHNMHQMHTDPPSWRAPCVFVFLWLSLSVF